MNTLKGIREANGRVELNQAEINLCNAALNGQISKVKRLMGKFEPQSDSAKKALLSAAQGGHVKVCRYLIKHGVPITCGSTESPLLSAIKNKHTEVAKILIEKRANVDSLQMYFACIKGENEIIELLLKEDKALLEGKHPEKPYTPLVAACRSGHIDTVRLLINNDANIENTSTFEGPRTTDNDWTPLMHAAECGFKDIVNLLLERGANVNAKSEKQFTALHAAVLSKNIEIVTALLAKGAFVNEVDHKGWAPHHLATSQGSDKILNTLRKAGANMELELPFNPLMQSILVAREDSNGEVPSGLSMKDLTVNPLSSRKEELIKIIDQKKCVICKETQHIVYCPCRKVAYCGKQHQKEDWSNHRQSCEVYNKKK